jgi:hypothetical protein
MRSSECLDGWSGGCWGVFIAPNHQFNRWGRLLSMGAPDSPVPHRTCTVHCPVHLLAAALTLRELFVHCSTFVGVRCSRPLRWSRCSAGAPDSLVRQTRVLFNILGSLGFHRRLITNQVRKDPYLHGGDIQLR